MIKFKNVLRNREFRIYKKLELNKNELLNKNIHKDVLSVSSFYFSTAKENEIQKREENVPEENVPKQKRKKKYFRKFVFLTIVSSYGIYNGLNWYEKNEKVRKEILKYPYVTEIIENHLIPFRNCFDKFLKKGKEHIKLHTQNVESVEEFYYLLKAMLLKICDNIKEFLTNFEINPFIKQKNEEQKRIQELKGFEKKNADKENDKTNVQIYPHSFEFKELKELKEPKESTKSTQDKSYSDELNSVTRLDKKVETEGSDHLHNKEDSLEMERKKSNEGENEIWSLYDKSEDRKIRFPIYFDEKENMYRNLLDEQKTNENNKENNSSDKHSVKLVKELERNHNKFEKKGKDFENFEISKNADFENSLKREAYNNETTIQHSESEHQEHCKLTDVFGDAWISKRSFEKEQQINEEHISSIPEREKETVKKVCNDVHDSEATTKKYDTSEAKKIAFLKEEGPTKELLDKEIFDNMLRNGDIEHFNELVKKEEMNVKTNKKEPVTSEEFRETEPKNTIIDKSEGLLNNDINQNIHEHREDNNNELIAIHVKGFPSSSFLKEHVKNFEKEIQDLNEKELKEKLIQMFINELISAKYKDVIANEEKEVLKKALRIKYNELFLEQKNKLQRELRIKMLKQLKEEEAILREKYEKEVKDMEENMIQLKNAEMDREKRKITKEVELMERNYLRKMNNYASDINMIKEKYYNEEDRKKSLESLNVILNQMLHLQNCLIHNFPIEKILPELQNNLEKDFFLKNVLKAPSSDFFTPKYKITNEHQQLKKEFYSLYNECVKEAFAQNNSNFLKKQFNKLLSYLYIHYEKPMKYMLMRSSENSILKRNLLNLSYASNNIEQNNLVEAMKYINELEGSCRNAYVSFNEQVKNMILFRIYLRIAISRLMLMSKNMQNMQNVS